MWAKVVTTLWMHVAIASPEGDGTHNQLILADPAGGYNKFAISLSTDEPLPFKLNEWFKGTIEMECSEVRTLIGDENKPRHGDWGTSAKAFICNADKLTVKGVDYILSPKRKAQYEDQRERQRGKHLQREERK